MKTFMFMFVIAVCTAMTPSLHAQPGTDDLILSLTTGGNSSDSVDVTVHNLNERQTSIEEDNGCYLKLQVPNSLSVCNLAVFTPNGSCIKVEKVSGTYIVIPLNSLEVGVYTYGFLIDSTLYYGTIVK